MDDDFIQIDQFTSLSQAILNAQAAIPSLKDMTFTGGSGQGWSMFSVIQKCPRAYYYNYVVPKHLPVSDEKVEGENLAVGGGVHALLACYYMFGEKTTKEFWNKISTQNIEPAVREEIDRIFWGYVDNYRDDDYIVPLAAEVRAVDPMTGNTCRYDLIARIDNPPAGEIPGVYIIEHKTLGIFSDVNLDSWDIDGEILGEVAFWDKGGFREKYGDLQGIVINIIGKQKKPQKFHRVFVHPSKTQLDEHLSALEWWKNYAGKLESEGLYPRATANCVSRYGRCDYYERCRNV